MKARQRKESHVTSARPVPRDALERQLAQIWEDALQVRPIGIDDNFFELGGDSLMAVGVFAAMEKSFGKQLSLAMLFQAPTIGALAEALRNDGWEPAWSSLILLRPNGTKPATLLHARGREGSAVHLRAYPACVSGAHERGLSVFSSLGLHRKPPPANDRVRDPAAREGYPGNPHFAARGALLSGGLVFRRAGRLRDGTTAH